MIPLRIQDNTLPKCIIVDIDGTIATRRDRGPHDLHLVIEDFPKGNVINIIKSLSKDYKVIFFSGRQEFSRDQTEHWLHINFNENLIEGDPYQGLGEFQLFMRKDKDQRKDNIVKKELFHEIIEDKFYVEAVIDDRNQVVDMWRQELGLTCFQVDYGDF